MNPLPPWANGPFELIVHAESHFQAGEDLGRSIALIGFDNAIEVAITTYLTLNPIQRGGRTYDGNDVDKWIRDYHTKLNFLEREIDSRNISWAIEKTHIIWVHDQRNEQYHGGRKGVPHLYTLSIARSAALWVFSVLFDVQHPEAVLEQAILDQTSPKPPSRQRDFDTAIDTEYGIMTVGEQDYYVSEILFSVDYNAYRDLGERLVNEFA